MKRILIPTVCLLAVLLAGVAHGFTLEGRIIDVGNGRGVAGLSVKVAPPVPPNAPRKLTLSDQSGRFRFSDLAPGTYSLEAYQGTRLLYSERLQLHGNMKREIRLKRR